jgi:hypothetical protein
VRWVELAALGRGDLLVEHMRASCRSRRRPRAPHSKFCTTRSVPCGCWSSITASM